MKRRSNIAFFLLICLPLILSCSPGRIKSATATPVPTLVSYEKSIYLVKRGPIVSKRQVRGEVVPARQDELFFRSSGYVSRVIVRRGDFVKKGEILAELQVDDIMNQLEQARIDLEVTQQEMESKKISHQHEIAVAEAEVALWQKRLEQEYIRLANAIGPDRELARLDLEMTQINLELAEKTLQMIKDSPETYSEQAVKRSQLAVQRLEELLAERQIVAPYDCVVLRTAIVPGQQVDAFTVVVTVGDPTQRVIRIQYIAELANLMNETTEVQMLPKPDSTEGVAIRYLPDFMPVTKSAELSLATTADFLYFTFPGGDWESQIPLGRSVDLIIVLGRKEDALLLPPAAIREYKGRYFVVIQDGERRRRVEINQIGLRTAELWEVNGELKEGELVIGP